jgi:hypothetical protein
MSFDWRDFHTLATELCNRPDEASKRSAISRAYYSVYCTARAWIERKLGVLVVEEARYLKKSAHEYVWDSVEELEGGRYADLAQDGKGLLRSRGRADYTPVIDKLQILAATEVVRAGDMLNALDSMP